jgi:hypothetical protein
MEMTTEGMQDPFSRFVKDFPEMYEVVRTVIVVRHRRLYKVEVLKDHTAHARFKVHFSRQDRLTIKPVDSKSLLSKLAGDGASEQANSLILLG